MRNEFRAKPRARRGVGFHLLVIGRSECDIGHGKDHPGLAVTKATPEDEGLSNALEGAGRWERIRSGNAAAAGIIQPHNHIE